MFALQFCAHRNGGLTRGVKSPECPGKSVLQSVLMKVWV